MDGRGREVRGFQFRGGRICQRTRRRPPRTRPADFLSARHVGGRARSTKRDLLEQVFYATMAATMEVRFGRAATIHELLRNGTTPVLARALKLSANEFLLLPDLRLLRKWN